MTGMRARSPAKGLGALDPGLDPGEEWAKGGVRLRGPSHWSGEGPERQIERSVWLRQRSAKRKKGPPRSGDKAFPPYATRAAEERTIRSRNLGVAGIEAAGARAGRSRQGQWKIRTKRTMSRTKSRTR